ncbi:hypothetical protein DL770_007387 [Monosporascus sp. CRB-9-2]|nr:hypothetical protein DL770_007387 [Monosporascus sp. CRB-9-2]
MAFKFTLAAAALASTAIASNTTGPFTLHITGKTDTSIDGYAGACHTGAAMEGLCYIEGPVDESSNYNQFYFDYGSYSPDTGEVYQPGWLSWLLHYTDQNGEPATQPSPLEFYPSWGSNVAVGQFSPSESWTSIGFVEDTMKLYMPGGYDDSSFNETYPNPVQTQGNLMNWHLCYQFAGSYYYRSISWVFTNPPQNPSCEPVDLTLELVTY